MSTEHSINPEIFREYDIRGLAGQDLTPAVAEQLGRAYAEVLSQWEKTYGTGRVDVAPAGGAWAAVDPQGEPSPVLVGRDNRLSSPDLAQGLMAGLRAAGRPVVDLGTVTTPMFYYARVRYRINGGIMVTASHNPPQYNGFKMALGPGTLYGDEIQHLGRVAERIAAEPSDGAALRDSGAARGGVGLPEVRREDVWPAYLENLTQRIQLGPRRLRVVVDCGNGTASPYAVPFLESLGCHVIPLYCQPDGRFPNHQPDPVQRENVQDLIREVQKNRADVGIAFDGDADRIGVVDDQGEILWGDRLMVLYWREILPRHPGATAIIEVKCSQALVEEVERLGGRPLFYRTGHSLIKAKMREIGAVFTGEMSGHMFFADEYFGFDDAFYAAGRLLRILSQEERPLSQLLAHVPRYYSTAETRVSCTEKDKFRVVQEITEHFRAEYPVIDVDGVRVLFPDGWALARASNTQPVIVARCEAKTREGLKRISEEMKRQLLAHPEVKPFDWEY
ncbi:MAG: phosphomannomutase/phosphoglucomutase [Firmicutes bacterium]|nr:phosphomannomutase/phosphoglucomutase [Bacillota bacterium]